MNPNSVVRLLLLKFPAAIDLEEQNVVVTPEETSLANQIAEMLISGQDFTTETTDELVFGYDVNSGVEEEEQAFAYLLPSQYSYTEEEDAEDDEDMPSTHSSGSSGREVEPSSVASGSSYRPDEEVVVRKPDDYPTLEVMKEMIDYWILKPATGGKKADLRAMSSVMHKYRSQLSKNEAVARTQLYRYKTLVQKNGRRNDKMKFIHDFVLQKFSDSRLDLNIAHDRTISEWAMEANQVVKYPRFKATDTWILNWKSKARVVSRKITRTVTLNHHREMVDVREKALDFVCAVKGQMMEHNILPSQLYNTDQSSINYEMHTGRTLAFKGSKHVTAAVQSLGATTHSFTVQPLVRADGLLHPVLFVCLQERAGQFPVTEPYIPLQAPNLYLLCSTSGKLTKPLILDWFRDVLFPTFDLNQDKKGMLLVDSWGGFSDKEAIFSQTTGDTANVYVEQMPPKVTGLIQPLDLLFFRPWKMYLRIISDYVVFNRLNISLTNRNQTIKLMSLVHYQFCAERYKDMIRYSWFKAGFIDERGPQFETPVQFSFQSPELRESKCYRCIVENIEVLPFARCSYCSHFLCFKCFYGTRQDDCDYHKCT